MPYQEEKDVLKRADRNSLTLRAMDTIGLIKPEIMITGTRIVTATLPTEFEGQELTKSMLGTTQNIG